MALSVRKAEYFYTRVKGPPEEVYPVLSRLAAAAVNLLAFSAVPFGPDHIELTLFPEDSADLVQAADAHGWRLTGPQHAFLVQGDDQLGALAGLHERLAGAGVSVYASSGVTDGRGRYGYLIYVKEGDVEVAARALEADPG